MRFLPVLCVFTTLLALPGPASAQTAESLVKSGQTVLNISASETKAVQQDVLISSLRAEYEGKDSTALQNKINTLTAKALEMAKKFDDVEVMTDNYYVYPYDPNQYAHPDPEERIEDVHKKEVIWRGSQGLQLKSKNSEKLLKLMGELQAIGFQTSSLNYTLSTEAFETIRDSLMESTLKKLSEKAKNAAKALGKSSAELVEVSVDTGYPQPPVMMMARAEMSTGTDAKMASPMASPGESEIVLTVSARAILK